VADSSRDGAPQNGQSEFSPSSSTVITVKLASEKPPSVFGPARPPQATTGRSLRVEGGEGRHRAGRDDHDERAVDPDGGWGLQLSL
jgi:hypothetical protein